VYTIVIAILLTIFFDLTRIASLGAILYLTMDILVHWGILRHLRGKMQFNPVIVSTAIAIDAVALVAFLVTKAKSDMLVIYASVIVIVFVFLGERIFLRQSKDSNDNIAQHNNKSSKDKTV